MTTRRRSLKICPMMFWIRFVQMWKISRMKMVIVWIVFGFLKTCARYSTATSSGRIFTYTSADRIFMHKWTTRIFTYTNTATRIVNSSCFAIQMRSKCCNYVYACQSIKIKKWFRPQILYFNCFSISKLNWNSVKLSSPYYKFALVLPDVAW